jgi:hypothetical protein
MKAQRWQPARHFSMGLTISRIHVIPFQHHVVSIQEDEHDCGQVPDAWRRVWLALEQP